jgi:hypothetical protein
MNGVMEWPPYCGQETERPTASGAFGFGYKVKRNVVTCVLPANGHRWHVDDAGYQWFW